MAWSPSRPRTRSASLAEKSWTAVRAVRPPKALVAIACAGSRNAPQAIAIITAGSRNAARALARAVRAEKTLHAIIAGTAATVCPPGQALLKAFHLVVRRERFAHTQIYIVAVATQHIGVTPEAGAVPRTHAALHPGRIGSGIAHQSIFLRAGPSFAAGAIFHRVRTGAAKLFPANVVGHIADSTLSTCAAGAIKGPRLQAIVLKADAL